MTPRYTPPRLPHRFSPGSKLFFGTVVGWLTCWVRSYGSCDMEHAAPGSVLHASRPSNASSGLPGPPAGGRGKDGRIHNDCSRYSPAAQREVASLCCTLFVLTFLYISSLCWRGRVPQATDEHVVVRDGFECRTERGISRRHGEAKRREGCDGRVGYGSPNTNCDDYEWVEGPRVWVARTGNEACYRGTRIP